MFTSIRIRGVGVIDDAVLELSPGLNVVTGETGAGKTMVVSGLGLLLGERADSGLVRAGADAALVEGVVELAAGHPALARAVEAGAEHDDGELVLARTVTSAGRSRAHVGGRAAPVGVLADLGQLLVAVHGQADQWRLRQGDAHRELLDAFGGPSLARSREQYADLYERWRAVRREHDELVSLAHERARDIDALTAALEEIEGVDPQPGEDVALRAEDERLSHAETLRRAAAHALGGLTGDEYAAEPVPNVADLVGAVRSALAPALPHDERLRALDERATELGVLAMDLSADLASYLDDVDLDPSRLEGVQERRAFLAVLTRKYGATVDEVLAWSGESAARLDRLVSADDRVGRLEAEVTRLTADVAAAALRLSGARRVAANDLGQTVTHELAELAMGRATLVVQVRRRTEPSGIPIDDGDPVRLAAHGADDVEILLAAGPGAPARSVTRAASGGELSRVMLALEVVGSGGTGGGPAAPPTFVFDEVDAGVGGAAALAVGARLAALAAQSQVIVVTHLAQVAAHADQHLVVHKSETGAITSSSVRVVDGDDRLRELSRMMGGDPDSEAGLAHARELLEQTRAGAGRPSEGAPQRGRTSVGAGA